MNSFAQLSKKLKIIFIILLLISVGGVVYSVYLSSKIKYLENPTLATNNEIKQLTSDIGKYMVLPTDETPTLATVSDPSKLRDQPFFANAMAGDKVLIYTISRKAILWRPSTSKIVEISALNPTPTQNLAPTNTTGTVGQ
jgi:hypothetical protein